MPAKPAWSARLDEIIAELERQPRPFVDRAAIEFLLGVGPRRAQQIIAPCVTDRVGVNGLADRNRIVARLRELAAGEEAWYERRRRQKLGAVIDRMRRAWVDRPPVLVEAPVSVVNQEFADLPPGIELAPGRITVRFDHPEQALQKLLALAMAIGNDRARFDRLTSLPPKQI